MEHYTSPMTGIRLPSNRPAVVNHALRSAILDFRQARVEDAGGEV